MRRALGVAVLVAAACSSGGDGVQTLQPPAQFLDYDSFVCDVQPTLVRRCSYLGCHGQAAHALRVFSVGKLRKAGIGSKDERDSPLTAEEIDLNFASASGMAYTATIAERDPSAPDYRKNPLLYKALAARFGGGEHHGVAVFPQAGHATPEDDPDFMALVRWSGGIAATKPLPQACKDLFDALGVAPRSP